MIRGLRFQVISGDLDVIRQEIVPEGLALLERTALLQSLQEYINPET